MNGFSGQAMRHVWVSLDVLDAARGATKPTSRDRGEIERAALIGSRFVRAHDDGDADGERQVVRLCVCVCQEVEEGARSVRADGAKVSVPPASLIGANPLASEGTADASSLSNLNEPSLLALVRTRYANRQIYSRAGRVLVALNPFVSDPAWLDEVYGDAAMESHKVRPRPNHRCCARPALPAPLRQHSPGRTVATTKPRHSRHRPWRWRPHRTSTKSRSRSSKRRRLATSRW